MAIIDYFVKNFEGAGTKEISAHVISFIALGVAFLVYMLKKRSHIILAKLMTDAAYAVHFILLGQFTAASVNTVNIGRGIVFYNRGSKKWASSNLWCVFFVVVTLGCAVFTWRGPISLMPTVGSSLAVIGTWSTNTLVLRSFNLAGVSLWFVYSILAFSPASMICNAIYIVTLIISIVREIIERTKAKSA